MCVCRCIICIEATKHTVLLTYDTSENYLKDSVVVAMASVRTWLEAGPEDRLLCQHGVPCYVLWSMRECEHKAE